MHHKSNIFREAYCTLSKRESSSSSAKVGCGQVSASSACGSNYTLTPSRLAFTFWVWGLRLRPKKARRQRLSLSNFTFLQRHSLHQNFIFCDFSNAKVVDMAIDVGTEILRPCCYHAKTSESRKRIPRRNLPGRLFVLFYIPFGPFDSVVAD